MIELVIKSIQKVIISIELVIFNQFDLNKTNKILNHLFR